MALDSQHAELDLTSSENGHFGQSIETPPWAPIAGRCRRPRSAGQIRSLAELQKLGRLSEDDLPEQIY